MRVLVLAPRFPSSSGKGDQVRTLEQVRGLSAQNDVTVVTAGRPPDVASEDEARRYATVEVHPSPFTRRAAACLMGIRQGRPFQVSWMYSLPAWRRARVLAARHDVVLVSTVRGLWGPLPSPVVLDHVDALSLNMRRRAAGDEPLPVRAFARLEARLLRRWERRAASWVAAQVAISREDAVALSAGPPVEVLAHNAAGEPYCEPADHRRDIDVIFTGTMSYPPNAEAARWLAQEIAPRIARARPGTAIHVVGRRAAQLRLIGVETSSDVPDMADHLRRARIALMPLRSGTGAPTKLPEAMTAGAVVVATSWAGARWNLKLPGGDDAETLAAETVRLLEDADALEAERSRQEGWVRGLDAGSLNRELEQLLLSAVGEPQPPEPRLDRPLTVGGVRDS